MLDRTFHLRKEKAIRQTFPVSQSVHSQWPQSGCVRSPWSAVKGFLVKSSGDRYLDYLWRNIICCRSSDTWVTFAQDSMPIAVPCRQYHSWQRRAAGRAPRSSQVVWRCHEGCQSTAPPSKLSWWPFYKPWSTHSNAGRSLSSYTLTPGRGCMHVL